MKKWGYCNLIKDASALNSEDAVGDILPRNIVVNLADKCLNTAIWVDLP